jgi:hypothetical protein
MNARARAISIAADGAAVGDRTDVDQDATRRSIEDRGAVAAERGSEA